MENKLKTLISDSVKNGNPNDVTIINKIYEVLPNLKQNNTPVIQEITRQENKEIVLTEIIINDNILYMDEYGGLWNVNGILVGSVTEKHINKDYIFFDKQFDFETNIYKLNSFFIR